MTRNEFDKWLRLHGACAEARGWLKTIPRASPETVWRTCPRGDWLIWWVDRAGAWMAEPRRAYAAARAEAWRVYEAARAEAGRAYEAATAEAGRAYAAATAEAVRSAIPWSVVERGMGR